VIGGVLADMQPLQLGDRGRDGTGARGNLAAGAGACRRADGKQQAKHGQARH